MGNKLSGVGRALYDSKRREFLGRDGGRWAKLGTFYFFFYLGLAGFFCAMLAVFMALTPRDHPYYYSHDSRMETRSNTLSPGLGFRPQPIPDKNLIVVSKSADNKESAKYATSLDQYLRVYYPQGQSGRSNSNSKTFAPRNPGACTNNTRFGFATNQPCVLVKLNKIVDFVPIPFTGRVNPDTNEIPTGCPLRADSVPVVCEGEFPADKDNAGAIKYFSEDGYSSECGSLRTSHFPYAGKVDRQDVYQAPYVWAQFERPKSNVLINVICRAYAANIDIDKKTGRGVTRFQIFVDEPKIRKSQEL